MSATETITVFVNERRVVVPRGATAARAAAGLGPEVAASGAITDARGLPVAPDAVLAPGAILRVAASARRSGIDADA